jgi:hypothetical protein
MSTINVIDDLAHSLAPGLPVRPSSQWMVNMARAYASRNGMSEIKLSEFGLTDEYQQQVARNLGATKAAGDADVLATEGRIASERPVREPRHKGDLGQY